MDKAKFKALEITTQLVAAKLSNANFMVNGEKGKEVADFYKEIYNGILNLTESANNQGE